MTSSFSLLVKLCLFVLASAVTACCSKKFAIQINKCVHKRPECPARLWKIRRPVSTSWEIIQPLSWLFKLKTSIWTHYSPPDPCQNTSEQQRRLPQNFSPPLAKDPLFSSHMLHVRKRQLLTNSICFNRAIGVHFNVADLRNHDRFVICIWHSPKRQLCFLLGECHIIFWIDRFLWLGETPASIDSDHKGCMLNVRHIPQMSTVVKDAFPKSFSASLRPARSKACKNSGDTEFFESGDPSTLHIDGGSPMTDWCNSGIKQTQMGE